jgi:hypothetical protein
MSGNAYLGLANLATHPAFDSSVWALVCPLCGEWTGTRVKEYEAHFLAHEPDAVTMERWLSAKSWEALAIKRGWLNTCGGSGASTWLRYPECPVCGAYAGRSLRGTVRPHPARSEEGQR